MLLFLGFTFGAVVVLAALCIGYKTGVLGEPKTFTPEEVIVDQNKQVLSGSSKGGRL